MEPTENSQGGPPVTPGPMRRIVVGLDLTDIDGRLVSYTGFMAGLLDTEVVYLLHVVQEYDLPDRSARSFPEVEASLIDTIRDRLDGLIQDHFPYSSATEVIIRVAEQDAAESIVAAAEEKEADLLVLGRKAGEDRQARYGAKAAAGVSCDLLFVPDEVRTPVRRVLCAVDFSDQSQAAFARALYLGEQLGADPVFFFIQDVTKVYFPVSTQKSADRTRAHAEEQFREFARAFGRDPEKLRCRVELDDELTARGDKIYAAAVEEEADLILVGAAGETGSETSLLGNVMETLRRIQGDIPIMIARDRRSGRGEKEG